MKGSITFNQKIASYNLPVFALRATNKHRTLLLVGTHSRSKCCSVQNSSPPLVGGGNLTQQNRKQNTQRQTSCDDSRSRRCLRRSVHSWNANTFLNRVENSTSSDRRRAMSLHGIYFICFF